MNTEMVRLNVIIPKGLFIALNKHAGPREKNRFIANAIRKQIEMDQKEALDKLLKEGYRDARQESLDITNEFAITNLEGW